MRSIQLATLLILMLTEIGVQAETYTELNFKWYQKNYDHVMGVISEIDSPELMPIINTIGAIWQFHDGAMRAEISPTIAAALIYHPFEMLSWFEAHPQQFEQWSSQLPETLLTDYRGDQSGELKKLKNDLEASLTKFGESSSNKSLVALARKLKNSVANTSVREIN